MGGDTLILVEQEELTSTIFSLLREYRSDVPDKNHREDAERIVRDLIYPSF